MYHFVFHRLGTICVDDLYEQNVLIKIINQIMVVLLYNCSYRYFSNYIIIKFVGIELTYYVINLNIIYSFTILSDVLLI